MKNRIFHKLNVSLRGNAEAPRTLLFSHGFGIDQTSWHPLLPSFEKDFRIVLYDLVGCGKSDLKAFSPLKYATLHAFADDLTELCEALKLKDATVVAHSVSCMIAMLASYNRPESFSKAILLNGSPCYLNDQDYVGGFDQMALDNLFRAMETNYYGWVAGFAPLAMAYPDKPELGGEFARTLKDMRPDIALAIAKTIFQSDVRKELDRFEIPSLIIQSRKDIAVPESVAYYLHHQWKNSQIKMVDAEGHFPQVSRTDEVLRAIKPFVFDN